MTDPHRVEVRPITAEESRPIRTEVLRPGQPPETLVYDEDEAADTLHVGGFVDGELVSVGRVSREPPPGSEDPNAWRLRGMATVEGHRGTGVGAEVLRLCLAHADAHHATRVWCNARVRARTFYERAGFVVDGEVFEVPGIGPHYLMRRPADRPGARG